jgi:hypothetical protein
VTCGASKWMKAPTTSCDTMVAGVQASWFRKCDVKTCCTDRAACSTFACPVGKKQKAGTHVCSSTPCTTADETRCCDWEVHTCSGANINCGVGFYFDLTKAGSFLGHAANCCTNKALCTTMACPDGMKRRAATWPKRYCSGKTCVATGGHADIALCCIGDPQTCGGGKRSIQTKLPLYTPVTCPVGKYLPLNKYSVKTDATKQEATCCFAQAKCATLTCPPHMKQKMGLKYCATNACTTNDTATCCENNPIKCGGVSVACAANHFKDPTKNAVVGTVSKYCCTPKAYCIYLEKCKPGMKYKKRLQDPPLCEQYLPHRARFQYLLRS